MGDSEGQTLLGGGSSSSSSSEELSSVRSMTSTFLLLSLDDRLGSCVSVLDVSVRKQEVETYKPTKGPSTEKELRCVPLSTPLKEAETSCTSFFDLMGAQFPSSLNWISSQSEQLFRISMNNLWQKTNEPIQTRNVSCSCQAGKKQPSSLRLQMSVLTHL